MKTLLFILVLFTGLLFQGCSKDEVDTTSCSTDNFGVLKIKFGATAQKHSILVTLGGGGFREKIVSAGKSGDTMRLAPGNNYPISVSSLDNAGLVIEEESFIRSISQCGETTVEVSF